MPANRRSKTEAKLSTVTFHVHEEPHILVNERLCPECKDKPCLTICPAQNYIWEDEKGLLIFSHEGCLECGSCRVICPQEAITWRYPLGGYGVRYRWG